MTPTPLEQLTTTPAPDDELRADQPYSPPPAATRRPPSSDWSTGFQLPQGRRWTIALAAALLVATVGIGLLYWDDTSNQNTIRALTLQNESLNGRNQILQDQVKTTQDNLTATLGQLAQTKADLAHPNLVLWTYPQQLKGPNTWLAGGIPDTFTYHLHVTSSGPMSVSILTLEDYAKAFACVNAGGSANYCMHYSGSVIGWLNKTQVDYDFHLAEGCADYLAVFSSASNITIKPNVTVTYNPSSKLTGVCAG